MIHVIPPDTRPVRADKYLASLYPEHSRSAVQRAFDAGLVTRNDLPISKSATLHSGDSISFSLPPVQPTELKPKDIPLDILFEDEFLLAINKPPGMTVHPGAGTDDDTLVHALLAHCEGQLSGIGGVERPGIVHRLDRETSGIIVVAKDDATHRHLSEQFANRTTFKQYLAIVLGTPSGDKGSIQSPIGRHPVQRHKMTTLSLNRGGREAHTDWEVEERLPHNTTLLRLTIHTGRTHQIRVHLKSIQLPILGDGTYGPKTPPKDIPAAPRTMLHATHLELMHPKTLKKLILDAAPPEDFQQILAQLRKGQ